MANEKEDMLYDLIQGLRNDMKDFSLELKETNKELNETKLIISKYNGLREQIGERDETISQLVKEVEALKDQVNCINNTSKGKQQAFEYIRKWTPWIITIASLIYASLQIGG